MYNSIRLDTIKLEVQTKHPVVSRHNYISCVDSNIANTKQTIRFYNYIDVPSQMHLCTQMHTDHTTAVVIG